MLPLFNALTPMLQNEQLEARLISLRIPVEICPTSNILTESIRSYEEHHFGKLFAAGHPLSISTDDSGMSLLNHRSSFVFFSCQIFSFCGLSSEYCRLGGWGGEGDLSTRSFFSAVNPFVSGNLVSVQGSSIMHLVTGIFDSPLSNEYAVLMAAHNLSIADLAKVTSDAIDFAFCDADTKV